MSAKQAHYESNQNYVREKEGGKGFDIKPKGLNIIWGKDSRYWKISENDAELIQVSWLEVSGMVKVKPKKKYRVQFRVSVKGDGFGWSGTKVLVMAKVGRRGRYKAKPVLLNPDNKELIIPSNGENESNSLIIDVEQGADDLDLYFGLYELWSGKWKSGLVIKGAEVIEV